MLAEAREQAKIRPSDYLHGVNVALLWLLGSAARTPVTHRAGETGLPDDDLVRQEESTARWSAGHAADLAVTSYCLGVAATLGWALGTPLSPPLAIVMTARRPPSGGLR